jgi:2-isopropylmalate synthase
MVRVPETQQKELYASQGIYTSDFNFRAEVQSQMDLPPADKIRIRDVTLREEVVYDKALSIDDKVRLASKLQEMGIHIIQLHGQNLRETAVALRKGGIKIKLHVLCRVEHPYYYRDWREMLDDAIQSGIDGIVIGVPLPQRLMLNYGWSQEEALSIPLEAIRYAKEHGAPTVLFGARDGTRIDLDYLKKICTSAVQAGADMIHIPDTAGAMSPVATKWLIQEVRRVIKVPITVHCHNDFGLGTANTLASLEAGAQVLDVVTNGADPVRSGLASTDEVVMAMKCLYNIDVGIKTEMFYEFARWFADLMGVPLHCQKPIVSDQMWEVRYDHGARAMGKNRYWNFPFSASLVGLDHRLKAHLGRAAGPNSVRMKMEELGLPFPAQEKLEALAKMVNKEATDKCRSLTDDELKVLVQKIAD